MKKAIEPGKIDAWDYGVDDPRIIWKSSPHLVHGTLPPLVDPSTGFLFTGDVNTSHMGVVAAIDPRLRVVELLPGIGIRVDRRGPVDCAEFDGRVIDRFVPQQADVERLYVVDSRSGPPDELVLSVDHVMNLAREHRGADSRDLGMQLHSIFWKATP